jgi:hypothetical protein
MLWEDRDYEVSLRNDALKLFESNDFIRATSVLVRCLLRPTLNADDSGPEAMLEQSATLHADVAKANDANCLCVDILDEALLPLMRLLAGQIGPELFREEEHTHSDPFS